MAEANWRSEAGKKGAAARTSRNNQYTRGRGNVEDMRARIKAGILLARLETDALGKGKLSKGQRDSAKILLDKAIPTLQAVESYIITEPAASRSEADILAELRALVAANPELIAQILAETQAIPGESVRLPSETQCSMPDQPLTPAD